LQDRLDYYEEKKFLHYLYGVARQAAHPMSYHWLISGLQPIKSIPPLLNPLAFLLHWWQITDKICPDLHVNQLFLWIWTMRRNGFFG